jgi:AhpC/TSA family.
LGWTSALVLAVLNLLIVRENSRLTTRLAQDSGDSLPSRVGELSGIGVDGQITRIRFDSQTRFLIFTFSAACPFCEASIDEWKRLAGGLDRTKWSVVWVGRDSVGAAQSFVQAADIRGPVLADVPHKLYVQLGLQKVPRTIVLSPEGSIVGSVLGALNEERVKYLSTLLTDQPLVGR